MEVSEAMRMLAASGIRATPIGPSRFATPDGRTILLSRVARRPTPSDVRAELERIGPSDFVLFAVDRATPSLAAAAESEPRILIASAADNAVWRDSVRHGLDAQPAAGGRAAPGRGPRPYGRFAVLRAMLAAARPVTQREIAAATGLTQPAVSQALRHLGAFVEKASRSWALADPAAAFDFACDSYPGAGGITTYWWSDRPLTEQVETAVGDVEHVVSGDLAAREISAWRLPERATLYAATGADLAQRGFAVGSRDDHTLSLTIPLDRTIAHTAAGSLADPVIVAHDVKHTGTTGDQDEAAEMIKQAALRPFESSDGGE